MKVIMYHYVRTFNKYRPYFRFLDVSDFERQLSFFEKTFGFVSKDEWLYALRKKKLGSAEGKVLLTFDDALVCHYHHVYDALLQRGLWGIFYVPTAPLEQKKMLDVHRIHSLCGAFDGDELLSKLKMFLDEGMIPDEKRREFREQTYKRQKNPESILEFKRILNYFIDYEYRGNLIDAISNILRHRFEESSFYVSVKQLNEIQSAGSIIGSHTASHPVMSKLSLKEQKLEIETSFEFLKSNVELDIKTYCHPYGGFHSFNENTLNALAETGVDFSFNVESRDVCDHDLISSIQFLPRYNCNEFPFGQAS